MSKTVERRTIQERQRDEREQREEANRAAGTALPPEEGGVELVSADDVLKGVAETGPNYALLPKAKRSGRQSGGSGGQPPKRRARARVQGQPRRGHSAHVRHVRVELGRGRRRRWRWWRYA